MSRQPLPAVPVPGETPWETALREAHEEIGLDPSRVELAGLSSPYRTAVTGFQIMPVVAFVSPDITLTPNPDEVADIFETPFGFLMDPLDTVKVNHDSTFALMLECQRRGIEVRELRQEWLFVQGGVTHSRMRTVEVAAVIS